MDDHSFAKFDGNRKRFINQCSKNFVIKNVRLKNISSFAFLKLHLLFCIDHKNKDFGKFLYKNIWVTSKCDLRESLNSFLFLQSTPIEFLKSNFLIIKNVLMYLFTFEIWIGNFYWVIRWYLQIRKIPLHGSSMQMQFKFFQEIKKKQRKFMKLQNSW